MNNNVSLFINLLLLLLFVYGAFDEFAASPQTTYHLIAGGMMLAGLTALSIITWRQFRGRMRKF